VWPIPPFIDLGSATPVAASPRFAITVEGSSCSLLLCDAITRHASIVRQGAQTSAPTSNTTRLLYSLELCVARPLDEHLGLNTSYSYAIRKGGNRPHGMNEAEVTATVTADSIYGAMHGMESFAQLAFAGSVPSANVTVRD
jgi:hypothetical protein